MLVTLKIGIQSRTGTKEHSNTTFQLACFRWLGHFTLNHFLQTAGTAICSLACFLLLWVGDLHLFVHAMMYGYT